MDYALVPTSSISHQDSCSNSLLVSLPSVFPFQPSLEMSTSVPLQNVTWCSPVEGPSLAPVTQPWPVCHLDVDRALDNSPLCMSQPHLSPPFRPHPLTHPTGAAGGTIFPFPILISCISLSHFPKQPPPASQKHSLCFFPGGGICVSLPARPSGLGNSPGL